MKIAVVVLWLIFSVTIGLRLLGNIMSGNWLGLLDIFPILFFLEIGKPIFYKYKTVA